MNASPAKVYRIISILNTRACTHVFFKDCRKITDLTNIKEHDTKRIEISIYLVKKPKFYSACYKKKKLIYFCTAYVKNEIIRKTINTVSFRGWMETTFRRQN